MRPTHHSLFLAASPAERRATFDAVPPSSRDAWLDALLGIDTFPADDPALPRGCVPYLPCGVDLLLATIDAAAIIPSDVFVDLGAGLGRALVLVHLLTGAHAIGVEIQAALAQRSRTHAAALGLPHIEILEADAADPIPALHSGTVFFLYCPFSGARLVRALAHLETIAAHHPIRICCVDLPLPRCDWLIPVCSPPPGSLAIYRSVTTDNASYG